MDFLKNFDSYDLKARVYPALLTLLPGLATLLAWHPVLLTSNAGAAVLTIINTCGLLYLFAELSRSQGQRAQRHLLKTWEVMPTTQVLRHADASLDVEVKARYHQHLGGKLGKPLPTADEERADPAAADKRYDSAVLWLMEQCRGPAHVLVLNENTSYGFRRNLYGLKPVGIMACLVSLLVVVFVVVVRNQANGPFQLASLATALRTFTPVQVGAVGLSLIVLLGWLCVVRAGWVLEAGKLYARRLLAACDKPPCA
ncbi:hypothetical protein [Brevundimonas sp.]|uniref:hypothetical protein n=1 Tax=Brevundimonas sp. TaxID=1871086 RepID=UPI0027F3B5AD|nr:hypothetical protein [Brevundimonas sp.]MDQ7812883.1 hypothetical protein [Brevundimonas sp.]